MEETSFAKYLLPTGLPYLLWLLLIFLVLVALSAYMIPTYIAMKRGHHKRVPILILNIFLGWFGLLYWTFLGWVAAVANKSE